MIYTCEKCNKEFQSKTDYTRHLNNKKPCNKNEKELCLFEKCICKHCEKMFSSSKTKKRHKKTCKKAPMNTTSKNIIITQTQQQSINNNQ